MKASGNIARQRWETLILAGLGLCSHIHNGVGRGLMVGCHFVESRKERRSSLVGAHHSFGIKFLVIIILFEGLC